MQSIVQLYQQGQYEQALNMALYYFHLARQQLGEQHPLFLASLENLATLYRETGNFTAAEPLYLQLLQIQRVVQGPLAPDVAISLHKLANLYRIQGRYSQAEPLSQNVRPDASGSVTSRRSRSAAGHRCGRNAPAFKRMPTQSPSAGQSIGVALVSGPRSVKKV